MARFALLSILLLAGIPACGGSQTVAPGASPAGEGGSGEFSADRAWSDLEALTALGPRSLGSEGARRARGHIAAALEAAGIAVESVTTTVDSEALGALTLTHLVALLPGASADRIVLIAPYDSGQHDGFGFVGANDGASGAALLLELARALAHRERPYSVELVWLQGEGRLGHGEEKEREQRWLGSRSLAARWAADGRLTPIRLLAVFNRVCDADLRIARDLGSHRIHREEFWRAARRLGRVDAFPPARGYETVISSHVAFRERGVRPIVAIEDTAFGGNEPPGLHAANEGDVLEHCAPESLATVGEVAIESIERIAARLAKIDRFATAPSAEPETGPPPASSEDAPAAEPVGEPAATASEEPDAGEGTDGPGPS